MKSIFIFIMVLLASHAVFAQQQKSAEKKNVPVVYSCPMHPEVKNSKPGKCPSCKMDLVASAKDQYTCPMHANIVSDHAGKCPECKMELVVIKKGAKQEGKAYGCPMHADITSDKPGKCKICAMELKKLKTDSIHQH